MGSDGRPARASRSPEISTLAASAITQSSLHRTRSGNIRRLELRGRTSADEIDKCALLGPRKSGRRGATGEPQNRGVGIRGGGFGGFEKAASGIRGKGRGANTPARGRN